MLTIDRSLEFNDSDYLNTFKVYLNNYSKQFYNKELNYKPSDNIIEESEQADNERLKAMIYLLWMYNDNYTEYYVKNGLDNRINESLYLLEEMKKDKFYRKDKYFNYFTNLIKSKSPNFVKNIKAEPLFNLKEQFESFVWQFIVQFKINNNLFNLKQDLN